MVDNAETIRGAYAAFAKGDIPAVLAVLDPQVSKAVSFDQHTDTVLVQKALE